MFKADFQTYMFGMFNEYCKILQFYEFSAIEPYIPLSIMFNVYHLKKII